MTPRRVLGILAALVVVALVVAVATLASPSVDQASEEDLRGADGRTAERREDRDEAIDALLARRADAVLARDREAFLADVDRTDADFLDSQEQLYDNLTRLRFAEFRYEAIGRDFHRPDLRQRYGRPIYVAALLLHYRLAGYDRAPVGRPQALTFVRRSSAWVIASDSDVDSELPETGHADPWDRRPIVVRGGEHVLLIADRADRGRLSRLRRAADEAVRRVADLWPDGWRQKIVVVAVHDPVVLETYFRTELQDAADVAAVAVPAYDYVPGWSSESAAERESGHPPRSRVILNPDYFAPQDADNRDLLTHEVAHVATQKQHWAGAPTWLVEGVAEYAAYRHLRPFTLDLPDLLQKQVSAGSLHLPTYEFYQRNLRANYLAGFLACAWVAERYGEATLRRLSRQLGRTPNPAQTGNRTRTALRKVLRVSQERFQSDVAAYAQRLAAR